MRAAGAIIFMPEVYASGIFFMEGVTKLNELFRSIQENLSFVVVCALIAAALILGSHLIERYLLPSKRAVSHSRRLSIIAMMGAIATVLHIFDFALPFLAPGFYKLDFSEIPVLMCGFLLGPSSAVACEGLKILLKLLLKGTTTAFVGDFANFVVGCALVLPASIVYHIKKTKKNAVLGMVLGTLVMTVFGSLFNAVYLLPKFSQLFGLPLESIVAMGHDINGGINSVSTLVLFSVAPLNLIKGTAVSLLTMLLYKHVEKPLFRK